MGLRVVFPHDTNPSIESTCSFERGGKERVAGQDLRCSCGSLLARLVKDTVELKCRRCKRILAIVALDAGAV